MPRVRAARAIAKPGYASRWLVPELKLASLSVLVIACLFRCGYSESLLSSIDGRSHDLEYTAGRRGNFADGSDMRARGVTPTRNPHNTNKP